MAVIAPIHSSSTGSKVWAKNLQLLFEVSEVSEVMSSWRNYIDSIACAGRSATGKQILRPKTLQSLWQDSLVEYGRKDFGTFAASCHIMPQKGCFDQVAKSLRCLLQSRMCSSCQRQKTVSGAGRKWNAKGYWRMSLSFNVQGRFGPYSAILISTKMWESL